MQKDLPIFILRSSLVLQITQAQQNPYGHPYRHIAICMIHLDASLFADRGINYTIQSHISILITNNLACELELMPML